jgi:hypothetical protein
MAPSGLFYNTISNFDMHRNTTHEDFTDDESQMVSVQDREGEQQYKFFVMTTVQIS